VLAGLPPWLSRTRPLELFLALTPAVARELEDGVGDVDASQEAFFRRHPPCALDTVLLLHTIDCRFSSHEGIIAGSRCFSDFWGQTQQPKSKGLR
jgi:hypothetical protein